MVFVKHFSTVLYLMQISSCINVIAMSRDSKECNQNNKTTSLSGSICKTHTNSFEKQTKLSPWCLAPSFDTELEPWKFEDADSLSLPWNYHYTFNILEIEEVNDKMQTISVVMYFRVKWMEPRLNIDINNEEWNKTEWADGGLSYSAKILDKLWYPNLEIEGIKRFKVQSLLKEMSNAQIYKSRHVRYGVRAEVTVSCAMNFQSYPLDHQDCPFRVSSYDKMDNTVSCTSVFTYNGERQRKLQYSISVNRLTERQRTFVGYFGNYSTCGFYVALDRKRSQTFCQVYLTCILFVIVSWVSFLIRPEAIPGRIGLLVTIFLVLVNIFDGAKSIAPVSENLNAIDFYLLFCIFLVFLALLEYALVLSRDKFSIGKMNSIKNIFEVIPSSDNNVKSQSSLNPSHIKIEFDTMSLIVFPIIFVLFNVIYWLFYF